jgi:hypothetical protein
MNKLSTWGMFGSALALMLAANGFAQQTPPPAVNSTPPPVTDHTPAAPATTAAGPGTQSFPAPAGSIETQRGDVRTTDLNPQPRETAPAASTFPAPSNGQPAAGFEHFGGGQRTIADGQRAELGVWLVESGGPGVQVSRITEGSAADLAGLQSGDVILQINGRGASSPHVVAQMIREIPAGQTAVVEYWRDGQTNEMEIVLQPARERREVGFRGDDSLTEMNQASGDIESRTMRLERQLATVMQELRQIRQEMAQIRMSSSGQTSIGGGGIGEATTATGFGAESAASATTAEPGAAITPPAATQPAEEATQDDAFGASTTEPAAEPATATEPGAEPTTEPAAEPATEPADEGDDLFGDSSTEEAAPATDADSATEEAAPVDDEAATESEPAEEAESDDDLFE